MCGKTATLILCSALVILQCRNDMKRVQSSVSSIAYVDNSATQIVGQLGVFVLRIQNKNLGIFRCHIDQERFGSVGFTGTGFSNDDHIGIDPFRISSKEINKDRNPFALSQAYTAFVGNMRIDPGIHCGNGVGRYSSSVLFHRVIGGYLGTDVCLKLCKIHSGHSHSCLGPAVADALFHIRNHRKLGILHMLIFLSGTLACQNRIIQCDIYIHSKKGFVIVLQCYQKPA